MIKSFRMFVLEMKIRISSIIFEHYKCKAIRYQHYVNMSNKYEAELSEMTNEYKNMV